MARCVLVAGSLTLVAALIAVGIAFFGPYWIANVSINEQPANATYFLYPFSPDSRPSVDGGGWIYVRGLWAECGVRCQWFWQSNYVLQKNLFTPISWHLATQVLYFVGASFVLLSVVLFNIQMCCYERGIVFRVLGAILLISFCLQTTAVAVFGAGAWRTYLAKSNTPILNVDWTTTTDIYFDWCYWMAVSGGGLTLVSGLMFLIYDCSLERREGSGKK